MRILALTNLYPPDVMGGYEIGCRQAVDALRERGHDARVLTSPTRLPNAEPDPPHVFRRLQLTQDRYWLDPEGGPDDAFSLLRDAGSRFVNAFNVHALTVVLKEFRPEVVYVNNLVGVGGLGLVAALQFLGVPWVWHLGDAVPHELCFARRDLIPALAAEFNRTVRGHYIAVSRQLLEEVRGHGFTLDGPVEVIPYWVTGASTAPPARPPGPLRIMSCGLVNRQKGIDILIEASALLREAGHEDFLVDIYGRLGDGTLPALVRRLGLTNRVEFKGPRPHDEVTRLYAGYDLLAFPTREREPFGIVPLEALAAGCVPVLTRRCGVSEWLVHGVHCLKAARNPGAFAGAFRSVLQGEVDLAPMARRGGAAVRKDFHLDSVLPRIERVLRRAAEEPRPASSGVGSAADAYRLARLAESLTEKLVQQTFCA